jgi:hypothetical protein
MRKVNGTLAVNQEESAKVFKDHFEKVYSIEMKSLATMIPISMQPETWREVANSPEIVRHAIRKMKTEKAPGKTDYHRNPISYLLA